MSSAVADAEGFEVRKCFVRSCEKDSKGSEKRVRYSSATDSLCPAEGMYSGVQCTVLYNMRPCADEGKLGLWHTFQAASVDAACHRQGSAIKIPDPDLGPKQTPSGCADKQNASSPTGQFRNAATLKLITTLLLPVAGSHTVVFACIIAQTVLFKLPPSFYHVEVTEFQLNNRPF